MSRPPKKSCLGENHQRLALDEGDGVFKLSGKIVAQGLFIDAEIGRDIGNRHAASAECRDKPLIFFGFLIWLATARIFWLAPGISEKIGAPGWCWFFRIHGKKISK